MRKIVRTSAALAAIVAVGAFGAPKGDRGVAPAGGGRGISGVMSDALDGIQNGIRSVSGCCTGPSLGNNTKIGAVRSDATYDGVGAIGGGVGSGSDPSGMGIGGGVQGNDPNDISGNSVGY